LYRYGELVQFGRGKIRETDESIERSKAAVANTVQVGGGCTAVECSCDP
jgi:hypothetical protein